AKLEFFEKKVRPVLAANCYNCHSANTNSQSGLRVDDRNGLLTGGKRGPAIVPGDPEKSRLIQAVKHVLPKVSMPPEKTLTSEEIADLARWIKDGAVWPRAILPASVGRSAEKYKVLRKEHWAFQPICDSQVPAVKDAVWPTDDVDRFVLAGLEKKGLRPVGDAPRLDLIRRVTFDLTGLPPTPAEVDAFVADQSPDAFAKVVDRLLASDAYGERWGRHWLDVARFGESTGSARNLPYPHAWRYRDWVIAAVTRDLPYNQFVRQQIAGDLLPADSDAERDAQTIATGFLAIGVEDVNQRFKVRFVMDNVDEQIDAVSRSFLALTASCARCHDHKFDPIPTADYYGLAGIFRSSDLCNGLKNKMGGGGLDYWVPANMLRLSAAVKMDAEHRAKLEAARKEAAKAKADFDEIRGTPKGKAIAANGKPYQQPFRLKAEKAAAVVASLEGNDSMVMGVREGKAPADTEIRVRGEAEQLGPTAPRGFLTAFEVPGAAPVNPKHSGRLELADWLASDRNPLTPRVMANRVWKHLFGQGIVSSVDNFGTTGGAPSDPELLDHLANQFVKNGWSVKKLIRTLVLTRAYRLSSESRPENLAADPGNRLVWRHSPRRLDAEEIRDAMLQVAGDLDRAHRTSSTIHDLQVVELRNNGPEAQKIVSS
ncbi:MAG TPA: PSD1 and planctomycete cytochrome C domain-containing protein, partial [Gemmataceae bacterium]|nr:PSD1 and planctomycete cytochrome C domain-containing protein [Gemmataceae bacterium]